MLPPAGVLPIFPSVNPLSALASGVGEILDSFAVERMYLNVGTLASGRD